MRHKKIKRIATKIRNKKQLVILEVENEEIVFLSASSIRQNTSLDSDELELLINSTIRVDYYDIGEKLFNGRICDHPNLIVKEYFIELSDSVDILRNKFADSLIPFKRIIDIFYFTRNGQEIVGIKTSDDTVTFISLKRFEIQSTLKKEDQKILIGSYINPVYYKIGDTLPNGSKIYAENKILRWLIIRLSSMSNQSEDSTQNSSSISYYDDFEEAWRKEYKEYNATYGDAFWDAFEGDMDVWAHYNQ